MPIIGLVLYIVIYLASILSVVVLSRWAMRESKKERFDRNVDAMPLCILGTLSLVGLLCALTLPPLVSHLNNVATIKYQDVLIQVKEDQISSVKEELPQFRNMTAIEAQVLLNADTPVATTLATLASLESQVATAREVKVKAEMSIFKRSNFFTAWVTWVIHPE